MRFIGIYNYTVVLTYLSLVSSTVGMVCAYRGRFMLAVCCLVVSGICDMFDGVVARSKKNRTTDEKNFGIQLDSLCDVVCFGVFPAVLLYLNGVNSIAGIAVLVFYVLCAVCRLAFFNVLEANRQMVEEGCAKSYRGLPVTSSAIIFPLFFLIDELLPPGLEDALCYALPLLAGFLFILDFSVPKLDVGKLLHRKREEVNV